ncbi:ecto-ADP-ribosyltransferase 5-like [Leptodactylus fuscus]|uniref:ecto-ADP-ribosyltransferase 5-like n=1 Tax=Leptodactylus fuscus TaxID=238119 RepID=UPI003F4EBD17
MAEDSFDDQYIGCTDKMESIAPEILKKERARTADFESAWKKAVTIWEERKSLLGRLPDGFKEEYGIALLTLSVLDFAIMKDLTPDLLKYGQDPESFRFHSLHFYVTRAMALLQPGCEGKPMSTYHYSHPFLPPSDPQATIRLGHLLTTSSNNEMVKRFGKVTLELKTCFGVKMLNFSSQPMFDEVLIPVNEVFRVSSYNKQKNSLILESINKKCSYYNCAYLGGTKSQNCSHITESSDLTEHF